MITLVCALSVMLLILITMTMMLVLVNSLGITVLVFIMTMLIDFLFTLTIDDGFTQLCRKEHNGLHLHLVSKTLLVLRINGRNYCYCTVRPL